MFSDILLLQSMKKLMNLMNDSEFASLFCSMSRGLASAAVITQLHAESLLELLPCSLKEQAQGSGLKPKLSVFL